MAYNWGETYKCGAYILGTYNRMYFLFKIRWPITRRGGGGGGYKRKFTVDYFYGGTNGNTIFRENFVFYKAD